MPSLADNIAMWNESYDWSQRGDEWSVSWGGPSYQWWISLFPRIQGFVPAGRILEIAPGYGRWTHHLRDLCNELIGVDIAAAAVAHCRERFAGDAHVSFHVNDGTSLAVAGDRSVDLVFSFDSLVHAEADVIAGYVTEFGRVLADDGVAFVHHSNMGSYEPGSYDPHAIHWRATTVSAALVASFAPTAGLVCVAQEPLAWGDDDRLTDCISVIARAGSRWDRGHRLAPNVHFRGHEMAAGKAISQLYPPPRPEDGARPSHAAALQLAATGDAAGARALLLETVRRQLDPEALNDLAVLAHRCGDTEDAVALLEALVRLHPEHAAAHENLTDLRG